MCLAGPTPDRALRDALAGDWHNLTGPWILFASDRATDLLGLCVIESEKAWIERILRSVSDRATYAELLAEYELEREVVAARRGRVRNALVHGSPADFAVITSVREYATFLSRSALQLGLEAYSAGDDPAVKLASRTAEYQAMQTGVDAATYWRAQSSADDLNPRMVSRS